LAPFLVLLLAFCFVHHSSAAEEKQETEGEYSETALRRFEIVTLTSLPFTSIYSYAIVRLTEMTRQGKVSPKLSDGDWNAVQVGAVAMAVLVGVWDWIHTRSGDRNEPRIPQYQESDTQTDDGVGENLRVTLLTIDF
jgi:hypothetical protein